MKEFKSALYPNRTPSPLDYENFDPSHPFAPYTNTCHMGFDSQLGGDFGQ
jgi:hypothetical protein